MEEFPTYQKAEDSIGFLDGIFNNKIIDYKPKTASIPAVIDEPTDFRKIAKSEITKWEKDKLESYEPIRGKGHWTIGLGNEYYDRKEKTKEGEKYVQVKPGEKITAEESQRLYNSRLENQFIPAVKKAAGKAWDEANDFEKSAMISSFWHMGANIGELGKTDQRRRIHDSLSSPNWRTEFPKLLENFDSKVDGVKNRMKANAKLFRTKPKQIAGTKPELSQNFVVSDNRKPKSFSDIADDFMSGYGK